jgi:hypothetical protein
MQPHSLTSLPTMMTTAYQEVAGSSFSTYMKLSVAFSVTVITAA